MDISHLQDRLEQLESRVASLESGAPQKPAIVNPAPPVAKAEHHSEVSVESFIGGRVLLRAGVIAILAAVGFFLKFAFEQHLLSDFFKVIVIALFGCAMVALGEYFAQKHRLFGHVIVGGGIAVWFFDVIAAHALYDFISSGTALILTLLLTAVMLFYSVKRESHPLLIASLSGAYLAPLFFSNLDLSASVQNGFALYSLIVTLGAFWFLHRKREWMMYFLFPIVGFGIHLLNWMNNDFSAFTGVVVIGIEFLAAFLLILNLWGNGEVGEDGVIALFLTQTGVSVVLMALQGNLSQSDILAPALYAWVAVCVSMGLWWLYSKREGLAPIGLLGNVIMVLLMLSIVNYFVELKIVYFLLLLAICGAAFAAITRRAVLSLTALLISFISLMLFVGYSHIFESIPVSSVWMSDTTLLLVLLIVVFAFQTWLVQFHKETLVKSLGVIAFVLAQITGIIFLTHQIDLLMDAGQKKDIAYSIGLILYGVVNVVLGFIKKVQAFRLAGLFVLGIAIVKVAFVDLWGLGTLYRIAVSLVLGVLLVSSSFLYHKFSDILRK